MQIPRWRCMVMLKTALVPTFSQSTISSINTHFLSFHSTPVLSQKWKNKWEVEGRRFQPSKTYTKYTTRLKRADAKRALKDLLFHSGSPKTSIRDDDHPWSCDPEPSIGSCKKKRKKSSAQRAKKSDEKMRRRCKKQSFSKDFDNPESTFRARFGNKWYTWSFNKSFQSSGSGWKEDQKFTKQRYKAWDSSSETETEESYSVGSYSDRKILGLPLTGSLKIDDVKTAFRLSALKWHPDKHQGPLQETAEEKFKLCVNAYKSLCDALS